MRFKSSLHHTHAHTVASPPQFTLHPTRPYTRTDTNTPGDKARAAPRHVGGRNHPDHRALPRRAPPFHPPHEPRVRRRSRARLGGDSSARPRPRQVDHTSTHMRTNNSVRRSTHSDTPRCHEPQACASVRELCSSVCVTHVCVCVSGHLPGLWAACRASCSSYSWTHCRPTTNTHTNTHTHNWQAHRAPGAAGGADHHPGRQLGGFAGAGDTGGRARCCSHDGPTRVA